MSSHETHELQRLGSIPDPRLVLKRTNSHVTATSTPESLPPRIVVDWDGPRDPQNPLNWSRSRKWLLTGVSCVVCFAVGLNGLAISSAADRVDIRFGINDTGAHAYRAYYMMTCWTGGAIVAPLIGLPLMETFGVRKGYLVSYVLFVLFIIPQALAHNYATLLIGRFLSGSFGSIVQNGVANVIGDLWGEAENALPVTLFVYAYLLGFTIAPVIGAAIVASLDWRWIFYIQLVFYAILLPITYFLVVETRGNIILLQRAKRLSRTLGYTPALANHTELAFFHALKDSTIRPLYMLTTEPVLFFFTLWSGLAIGNVFLATQSISQIFSTNYAFDAVQAGYVQAAMAVGMTVGLGICILQNHIFARSAKRNLETPGKGIPESRLELSIPCSFIGFAGGLFIYAWTSWPTAHAPWIWPAVALGFVGAGIMVVVSCAMSYVTDFYGIFAGSAVAAVAAVENVLSSLLPLASERMYTRLGFAGGSGLLAGVALCLSFAPVVLYVKGKGLRERSKFGERMKVV